MSCVSCVWIWLLVSITWSINVSAMHFKKDVSRNNVLAPATCSIESATFGIILYDYVQIDVRLQLTDSNQPTQLILFAYTNGYNIAAATYLKEWSNNSGSNTYVKRLKWNYSAGIDPFKPFQISVIGSMNEELCTYSLSLIPTLPFTVVTTKDAYFNSAVNPTVTITVILMDFLNVISQEDKRFQHRLCISLKQQLKSQFILENMESGLLKHSNTDDSEKVALRSCININPSTSIIENNIYSFPGLFNYRDDYVVIILKKIPGNEKEKPRHFITPYLFQINHKDYFDPKMPFQLRSMIKSTTDIVLAWITEDPYRAVDKPFWRISKVENGFLNPVTDWKLLSSSSLNYIEGIPITKRKMTKYDLCAPPSTDLGFIDPGYLHLAYVKLESGSGKYYYRVGTASKFKSGSFDTSNKKIAFFGDYFWDKPFGHSQVVSRAFTNALKNKYGMAIIAGDVSYSDGQQSRWDDTLSHFSNFASTLPLNGAMGNHDRAEVKGFPNFIQSWVKEYRSHGECGAAYQYRFGEFDAGHDQPWYSFDYGNAHFLVMSSEHDLRTGSCQYNFIIQDLMEANKNREKFPYIFVVNHRPFKTDDIYPENEYFEASAAPCPRTPLCPTAPPPSSIPPSCSMSVGPPLNESTDENLERLVQAVSRRCLEHLFYECFKITMLLTGHHHVYQRYPPDIDGRPSPDGRGLYTLVVGTGGFGKTYTTLSKDPKDCRPLPHFYGSESYGFLEIDLDDSKGAISFVYKAFDSDGSAYPLDSFQFSKINQTGDGRWTNYDNPCN